MRPRSNAYWWLLSGLLLLTRTTVAQSSGRGPYLCVQIGGGQGLLAVGAGYRPGQGQLEPEVLLGFVPRRLSNKNRLVVTAKATWVPRRVRVALGEQWAAQPVAVGGYVSFTPGQQFFLTSTTTGRYPPGYYWWSAAVRVGATASLRLAHVPRNAPGFRQVLYAEWSTNDLYLISYLTNKTLRISEILVWGAGAKASF